MRLTSFFQPNLYDGDGFVHLFLELLVFLLGTVFLFLQLANDFLHRFQLCVQRADASKGAHARNNFATHRPAADC